MAKATRRNRMNKFRINEISGVDVPAQEGAEVLIMKRAIPPADSGTGDDIAKHGLVQVLTGETSGHQHGIEVRVYDGKLSLWVDYAVAADGSENQHGHGHAIVFQDGEYKVSTNAGHTHTLSTADINTALAATVQKSGKDADVTPKEIEAMEAANKRMDTIIKLSAEHRAHFDALGEEDREPFLVKSAAERDELVAKAIAAKADPDPVTYTTKDGIEIRKSEGKTALALAKAHDKQGERLDAVLEQNADLAKAGSEATYEKRADTELEHMPGAVKTRARMLKAIDTIEDETEREDALKSLRAQNASMAGAFKSVGSTGDVAVDVPGAESATEELNKLTKAYVKEHSVHETIAYARVLETPEGQDLYSQTISRR